MSRDEDFVSRPLGLPFTVFVFATSFLFVGAASRGIAHLQFVASHHRSSMVRAEGAIGLRKEAHRCPVREWVS